MFPIHLFLDILFLKKKSIPRSRMLMAEPNKPEAAVVPCFPSSRGKPAMGMDEGATLMLDFKGGGPCSSI